MREEKLSIIEEFRSSIADASFVIFVDHSGMKAAQANELRHRLLDLRARMRVVKNNLLKRAIDDEILAKMEGVISGPLAMVFGQGDPVAVSKLLGAFAKEHRVLSIKTGIWETQILSEQDIESLVNLPPKSVLHGMAVSMLAAPMVQLVGVMRQRLTSLLYVLKAIEEKQNRR